MNPNKQALLIDVLIGTPDLFSIVSPLLQPRYFDPEFRGLVDFVLKYQQNFNGIPPTDVIKVETGCEVAPKLLSGDAFNYACTEFESFCKRQAINYAIRDSVALIEQDNYGEVEARIRAAVTTSLTRSLGTDFFEDPEALIKRVQENIGTPISTGYDALDDALGGGVYPTDLIIFSANSGGGKSITMDNLATNWHNMGRSGVYFSFELSEDLLAKRHMSMVTEVDTPALFARKNEVAAKMAQMGQTAGRFHYVRKPVGTKPSAIRAYLKEYELTYGETPDYMVFDYMGLMMPDVAIPMNDVYLRDKLVSEALREIGNDYGATIVTASQQNRSAVGEVDIDHSHIAGGISKIDTCDIAISIVFTDAMRANGEIGFNLIKTRNSEGVGKTVFMKWIGKYLRIQDPDDLSNAIRVKGQPIQAPVDPDKKKQTTQPKIRSALADLIEVEDD